MRSAENNVSGVLWARPAMRTSLWHMRVGRGSFVASTENACACRTKSASNGLNVDDLASLRGARQVVRSKRKNSVEEGMKREVVVFLLGVFCWSVLASAGLAQTANSHKSENLQSCLTGIGQCDRSLLTSAQAQELAEMHQDRNLWECLKGYATCDHSALNDTESKEVAKVERARNLLACETALDVCDESLLNAVEKPNVAELRL